MGTMRWTRWAFALGGALLVAIALGWCGPRGNVPRLEEVPPGATADIDAGAGALTYGDVQTITGTVTGQVTDYGEPYESAGTMMVTEVAVLSIERTGGAGTIELEVPRDEVPYPPGDSTVEPLDVPDGELRFTVRERSDGRYVCATIVCITPEGADG